MLQLAIMPIRTTPWDDISISDVQDLIARRVREDRTLEFKEEFPFNDSGKLNFLQDVTAMANAEGGTLIYGAHEGSGDDKGLIVGFKPPRAQCG
jgi:predicted HTH transcriptional regulator